MENDNNINGWKNSDCQVFYSIHQGVQTHSKFKTDCITLIMLKGRQPQQYMGNIITITKLTALST